MNTFAFFEPFRIISPVRSLKTFLVLFLALSWVPMAAHCKIEAIPGFEFLSCKSGDSKDGKNHCGDKGCCTFESSVYKNDTSLLNSAPLPAFLVSFELIPFEGVAPRRDLLFLKICLLPPELPTSWQFSARTALPVRAPSCRS